jgi:hypothetical protein
LAIHPNEGWDIWAHQHINLAISYQNRSIKGNYYTENDLNESKYGIYTEIYLRRTTFREGKTPELNSTSYGNETYEPTKLCIVLAFLKKIPLITKEDWYN